MGTQKKFLSWDLKSFLIAIVLSWDPDPGDQPDRPDWHVRPEDGLEGELADLDHEAEIDVDVGIDDGFGVDGPYFAKSWLSGWMFGKF